MDIPSRCRGNEQPTMPKCLMVSAMYMFRYITLSHRKCS